ncbi:phage tail assembly chaperone [Chenggangzhangella methanolivorans]|uniref:Uncharacterized protein n=1 Tax=Chenggangzhangella methanolivorans TaxID=1437009 RepID=A0A9E6RAB2_9HYPH|nr:hypothetical protein [Chenggangzhangella methanolivorans]QZN99547.1 hypothetical protein K6K41_23025 [Chenggangzhangella methanolivorans]
MPAALIAEPRLPDALLFYLEAFFDLTNDRAVGMGGAGAIPFGAIDAWARRYNVSGDAFDRLKDLIGRMDRVWSDLRQVEAS